jgi:serine/threonine protein kinase
MKSKLHTRSELEHAQFELKLHSGLSHHHILPLLEGEETPESIIIVTPLAWSDLYSATTNKVLSEVNCQRLCKQLLLALDYLHSEAGIVHFDMKPQNILLFESSNGYIAKICDFGFCEPLKIGDYVPFSEMRGSLGYFSPEQLRHESLSHAVDMFALGVIMYQLLCGYEPFYPTNKVRYLNGDWEGNDSKLIMFDSPYWDKISKEAKEFIVQLLNGDPKKRLTAKDALSARWIRMDLQNDSLGDINVPFATK